MDDSTQNNNSWQQPDYGDRYKQQKPALPKKHNGMATASFIIGLFALLSCCCSPLGLILGVTSLILVILSKKGNPFEPFAVAGLVLSIIAIVASLASFAYYIMVLNMMQDPEFNSIVNGLMEQYESMPLN